METAWQLFSREIDAGHRLSELQDRGEAIIEGSVRPEAKGLRVAGDSVEMPAHQRIGDLPPALRPP
jgi:hypothetical protein